MELVLDRKWCKETYSIGHLYIDGQKFCDTLEDKDRGLTSSMTEAKIKSIKIKGETAIPKGQYTITLKVVSPKYSNFKKYPYAKVTGGKMPRILGLKGFSGVLIHAGNNASHTEGCLLVGENKVKGGLVNSQATFLKLYAKLKAASDRGETISITIK